MTCRKSVLASSKESVISPSSNGSDAGAIFGVAIMDDDVTKKTRDARVDDVSIWGGKQQRE